MIKPAALSGLLLFVSLLICVPAHALVQGHVIDTNQNPIVGARVRFTEESSPYTSYSAVTDADGFYQIDFAVSVDEEKPVHFQLGQNYPNPFNPATTIPFSLDTSSHVSLTIYNIMGQRIATLADQHMNAGQHTAVWDGMDDEGNHVSSGIYFYRLKAGRHVETRKMLLLDGGRLSGGSTIKPFYGTGKIAGETAYTVNITHSSIVPYEETVVTVDDWEMRDFIVTMIGDPHEISGMTFASIPGGTFQMGAVEGGGYTVEKPVHSVTVSDFEMSIYEATNAQYVEYLTVALASGDISASRSSVTGATGEWAGEEYLDLDDRECEISYSGMFSVVLGKENCPVIEVTWYGAKAFAEHYGFDLPTEAEWEYASRWGSQQYRYGTDDGTIDSSKANYNDNVFHTTDVGSYPANPFGLFDMSGNVWEWCHDWWGLYTSESEFNPTGEHTGSHRVKRGGGWIDDALDCRSSLRGGNPPDLSDFVIGFRVVRRPNGVIY